MISRLVDPQRAGQLSVQLFSVSKLDTFSLYVTDIAPSGLHSNSILSWVNKRSSLPPRRTNSFADKNNSVLITTFGLCVPNTSFSHIAISSLTEIASDCFLNGFWVACNFFIVARQEFFERAPTKTVLDVSLQLHGLTHKTNCIALHVGN